MRPIVRVRRPRGNGRWTGGGATPRPDDPNGARRRITGALFVGNALASTAYLSVLTIAALAARDLTGSDRLAGGPNAISTVGAVLGAMVLSSWSQRVGRRAAFGVGFAIAALGGAIGVASLRLGSFALLLMAMAALGIGRAVSQLSRFAAGDLWPAERRASAIGLVVWAATIGSVVGPLLIVPTSRFGVLHLGAELAGPFAVAAVGFAVAALWYAVALRPEPLTLAAAESGAEQGGPRTPTRSRRRLLAVPTVQLAVVAMTVSQLVMVLVMTMTPVHIRHHHQGLALVSGTMMAHTVGMFALAPLTGILVDRLGARRVIAAGALLLMIATLLGALDENGHAVILTISMFVLGVGWNLGFVAGSVVLLEGLPLNERLRVQGLADSLTWISGGSAALASGLVLSVWSFRGLGILGAGLALVPLWGLRREASAARARAD